MNKKNLELIKNLRHELHANPELSMNESGTKRRLMHFIEQNTNLAVIDCGKWFYASRYVEGTKGIAFRADMDALPMDESLKIPHASKIQNVSHKCGHDGHCAVLCGLALELEKLPPEKSVYLIFQHAEEIGQGARECSNLLRERSISEIYAFHNWSGWPEKSIVVREGLCHFSSSGLTIKFTGKTSHASEPEKGLNPAKVMAELILNLELVAPEKGRCHEMTEGSKRKILCTVVNIKLGEKNFGISPGEGEVSLTLRAEHEEDMRLFRNAVVNMAKRLAEENSMSVECIGNDYFPETLSDSKCVSKIKSAAKNLCLKIIDMPEAIRASEDFGFYTKQIHGAIFYIGNGENYPEIHTSEYDFNDEILETGVEIFKEILNQSK